MPHKTLVGQSGPPTSNAHFAIDSPGSGASEEKILITQNNLAVTYARLGRLEQATCLQRDVYSGRLKLYGDEHSLTLVAAVNYATSLEKLNRFEEAKSLVCKAVPVARRVLGESDESTLKIRWLYGRVLYSDTGATLDDLREAVTTLEETERIARRMLGGAHPLTVDMEKSLRKSRAVLAAREGDPSARTMLCEALKAM